MKATVTISKKELVRGTINQLPASKSISNRVLIINALAGGESTLDNLSDANDTTLMRNLLNASDDVLDVEDAGTTMRFLTAYLAISNKQKTLTGTERMKKRPIAILVDALRELGASIDYLGEGGYPPIRTRGFAKQQTDSITIRGDVSSQYVSALMMIAPILPKGLTLTITGNVGSRPYIEMTASLMKHFGAEVHLKDQSVRITSKAYQPANYWVEADWSAASYWFAFAALAKEAEILLPWVSVRSLQGDRIIIDMMEQLGVKAEPRGNNLLLAKKEHHHEFSWDFTDCPDLAQTVAVVCAAKGIHGTFTGLESLRIKETDRIKALQNELGKLGASLKQEGNQWLLHPSAKIPSRLPLINTYLDHRMAMAFAPLAARADVSIEDPSVVRKSYPGFWKDIAGVGFSISGA